MTTAELAATSAAQVAAPFARLIKLAPTTVLPTEEELTSLQDYYSAHDHPDFHHPEGYEPWKQEVDIEHYMRLPFSLALALHPTGPQVIGRDNALGTYRAFAAIQPAGMDGMPNTLRRISERRATSILSATILHAAINPPYRLFPNRDRVSDAIDFARQEDLLSRTNARLLRGAIELATRH